MFASMYFDHLLLGGRCERIRGLENKEGIPAKQENLAIHLGVVMDYELQIAFFLGKNTTK